MPAPLAVIVASVFKRSRIERARRRGLQPIAHIASLPITSPSPDKATMGPQADQP
jgi:hypothetical protein